MLIPNYRIVLDPVFQPADLSILRKSSVNELPQEIKFTLVFDEATDGPELDILLNNQLGPKDEIESDEEEALV